MPPAGTRGLTTAMLFRFSALGSRLLMTTVVLVAIDLAGLAVLLAVHLGALLRGEFATVRSTVVADFVVNLGFIVFEVRGLAGGELSALDALSDAVLLVLGSLANFALGIRVLDCRVVLVLVNLLGHLILLLGQSFLVGSGQLAVIELAHVALFLVDRGFLLFQVGGFTSGQFPALHAVSDTVLLVLFSVLNALAGYRRRGCCSWISLRWILVRNSHLHCGHVG